MQNVAASLSLTSLPPPKDIFAFGETNRRVTAELNALALAGKKTATTSFPVPDSLHWGVGDLSIGLDENDKPCFVMRTTELIVRNFEDVPESFARNEGEGDLTLEWYRKEHISFYNSGGYRGKEIESFGDGTGEKVLCERFEIVWPILPKEAMNEMQGH